MTVHDELGAALRELEATMKANHLWRMERPPEHAFTSQQPFCIDTMALPQWLRFVFIVRLESLVQAQATMPAKCDVTPAVEACLIQEGASSTQQLLMRQAVERVDRLVTEN